jgi:hypothetical protein
MANIRLLAVSQGGLPALIGSQGRRQSGPKGHRLQAGGQFTGLGVGVSTLGIFPARHCLDMRTEARPQIVPPGSPAGYLILRWIGVTHWWIEVSQGLGAILSFCWPGRRVAPLWELPTPPFCLFLLSWSGRRSGLRPNGRDPLMLGLLLLGAVLLLLLDPLLREWDPLLREWDPPLSLRVEAVIEKGRPKARKTARSFFMMTPGVCPSIPPSMLYSTKMWPPLFAGDFRQREATQDARSP